MYIPYWLDFRLIHCAHLILTILFIIEKKHCIKKCVASDATLRQSSGLPSLYYHHSSSGLPTNPSPTPSTNSHRSGGSYNPTNRCSSNKIINSHKFCLFLLIIAVSYPNHGYGFGGQTGNNCTANSGIACLPTRAVHERSHSDGTTAPLPSVDLSMESSSVTSLSNLPLRKHTITSGKYTFRTIWREKKNGKKLHYRFVNILQMAH